jgi:hypothetical protein
VGTSVSEEHAVSIFRAELPVHSHGIAIQKTNIDIITAMRTSDLIYNMQMLHGSPQTG